MMTALGSVIPAVAESRPEELRRAPRKGTVDQTMFPARSPQGGWLGGEPAGRVT